MISGYLSAVNLTSFETNCEVDEEKERFSEDSLELSADCAAMALKVVGRTRVALQRQPFASSNSFLLAILVIEAIELSGYLN